MNYRGVAQPVARLPWEQEAARSNRAAPTTAGLKPGGLVGLISPLAGFDSQSRYQTEWGIDTGYADEAEASTSLGGTPK